MGEGGKQRRGERGGKREEGRGGGERGRKRKGGELLVCLGRNLSLLQQLYHLSKQDRPHILSALYATICTLCSLWNSHENPYQYKSRRVRDLYRCAIPTPKQERDGAPYPLSHIPFTTTHTLFPYVSGFIIQCDT